MGEADRALAADGTPGQEPLSFAHQIAVATRDVRCKARAEWVRTWVGVERAVQGILVERHAADLARERRHKEQQLTAAREVNGT